jgi:hypothetical protein
MRSFVLIAGSFVEGAAAARRYFSMEDLLQPSIKRLVDSSRVFLRKRVIGLGRRLKVVIEGS